MRISDWSSDVCSSDLLRGEEPIWAGNRFMVYALYLQCNVSVHVLWGVNRRNTVLAVGKTIFGRAPSLEIGPRLLHYGGGGHEDRKSDVEGKSVSVRGERGCTRVL